MGGTVASVSGIEPWSCAHSLRDLLLLYLPRWGPCSDRRLFAPTRSAFGSCSRGLDHQATGPGAISSENFFRSIFPPDTMATIGPCPAFPVSAAATGRHPAPSAMIHAFSALNRMALFVSSRVTTILPSTTGFIRCHIRGKTLCPPAPSTKDAFQSLNAWGDPLARESDMGAAVSGSAPHTLIPG